MPDTSPAEISSETLETLKTHVDDGLITVEEAWTGLTGHEPKATAQAGLAGGIDRTHADHLEVVISRDRIWVNEDGVCVARWYGIENLQVRDTRTSEADAA
jgi:hypothetical protein